MTAVATFPSVPRAGWPNGSQANLNQMSPDEVARLFLPRKGSQRGPSQNTAEAGAGGVWSSGQLRGGTHDGGQPGGVGNLKSKKTTRGGPWPQKGEMMRGPGAPHTTSSSVSPISMNNSIHQPNSILPSQHRAAQQTQVNGAETQPISYLMLLPLNNSFEAKFIPLPYYPETLRIGRQTNAKTLPTPSNGYFDSKVLSRQHAEVWAEQKTGKVWIRDVKSSNGTFVNGTRLSQENRDSEPHELRAEDILELGIDIFSEDNKSIIHHKVAARVEHAGFQTGQMNLELNNMGDIDPIMQGGLMSPQMNGGNNFPRGRAASQNSRVGSGAGAQGMNHRGVPMFMHSVSVEQIVKKLNSELHMAKQQAQELQRTTEFFDQLLSLEVVRKEPEVIKKAVIDEDNGGQSPRMDSGVALEAGQFPTVLHAPLPPPAKHITIVPEDETKEEDEEAKEEEEKDAERGRQRKGVRAIAIPPLDHPQLPRSSTNAKSPKDKPEAPQHLFSLVTQLRDARLELEAKSARVKDLEDLLRRERTARELAEDRASQLEVASRMSKLTEQKPDLDNSEGNEDNIRDDISIAGSECTVIGVESSGKPSESDEKEATKPQDTDMQSAIAAAAAEAAAEWKKRLEDMMKELQSAKEEIETYKKRVRIAEEEGEHSRRTLAEMVAKIRADEERRRNHMVEKCIQTERRRNDAVMVSCGVQAETMDEEEDVEDVEGHVNGAVIGNGSIKVGNGTLIVGGGGGGSKGHHTSSFPPHERPQSTELVSKSRTRGEMARESAPYVSIVGVVIIGVGIMTILNNWQRVER